MSIPMSSGIHAAISGHAALLCRERSADPWRELAVAVIGNALADLARSKPVHNRISPESLKKKAIIFLASPDLDAWAQFTSMDARQWRAVAEEVQNGKTRNLD